MVLVAFLEWCKNHANLVRGLMLTLLIGLAIFFALAWYDKQLSDQYNAGYAKAVAVTNDKWKAILHKAKDDNDQIVKDILAKQAADAVHWQEDVKARDAHIADLLDKMKTIMARDASGKVLYNSVGQPLQCYMGQDFADAWNTINKDYGLVTE